MKKYAVIDIGSLKVKLLVAEVVNKEVRVIKKDSKLTCLGKGIKGTFHKVLEGPLRDTVDVIKDYIRICDELGVQKIRIIATESLRKARNLDYVLRTFEKSLSCKPDIITQEDEAKAFFKAVTKDFPERSEIAVVDMGGGSIQVLIGNKNKLKEMHFLPLGVYFLGQKFVSDNSEEGKATEEELRELRNYIQSKIEGISIQAKKVPLVYGSSNVLDLFKLIDVDLNNSDLSSSHPLQTSPSELTEFLDGIKDLTHQEREDKYQFQYGYMWGIQMAFYNAYYLAKHLKTETIIPSNVNIAEGYVLEMI